MRHIVFDHDGTLVDTDYSRELFPGISNLLDKLEKRGDKLFVWTARNRASTVEFLKSLGIISRFEDICTPTDAAQKPSPDGLHLMLESIDPKDVIVIGDSFTDMIGAKKYGAFAIGALWANPSEDKQKSLIEFGADTVFKSIDELENYLLNGE